MTACNRAPADSRASRTACNSGATLRRHSTAQVYRYSSSWRANQCRHSTAYRGASEQTCAGKEQS
eukprot:511213-Pelagomonas_calceolata.AAC.2